jgi:hypothetical protein
MGEACVLCYVSALSGRSCPSPNIRHLDDALILTHVLLQPCSPHFKVDSCCRKRGVLELKHDSHVLLDPHGLVYNCHVPSVHRAANAAS